VGVAPEKTHDNKKYWNTAARYLSDSCWNHYALSPGIGPIVMGVLALVTGILILVGK
jgi:hypothetical protein